MVLKFYRFDIGGFHAIHMLAAIQVNNDMYCALEIFSASTMLE